MLKLRKVNCCVTIAYLLRAVKLKFDDCCKLLTLILNSVCSQDESTFHAKRFYLQARSSNLAACCHFLTYVYVLVIN